MIVAAAAAHSSINPQLILFLKVGICGGFTTFSTFALETVDLMNSGSVFTALLYVVLSAAFGVVAVVMGELLVNTWFL